MDILVFKKEIDGGRSLRKLREHMQWHKDHPAQNRTYVLLRGAKSES